MKLKFVIFSCFLSLVGCVTVSDLKAMPTCQVWDQANMGGPPRYLAVNGLTSRSTTSCLLFGYFCSWVQTQLQEDGRITFEGSAFGEGIRDIGVLEGNQIRVKNQFLKLLAESSDPVIDPAELTVTRTIYIHILGVQKQGQEIVHFNSSCQMNQAAVGAMALWATKSKASRN